jgi:FSR family fosmidomycin resistance protein-like MFS transporter
MSAAEGKGAPYLFFLASTHFVIHVFTMLLPVLLLPFQEELGVSLVQLSLLASVPRLVNVFIYIPAGVASDRRPSDVLTWSFIVTLLGAIVIPLSHSFLSLLLGFTLIAVGSTLYHPPSLRMASEYDPRKLTLAMGIHNTGSSLGFAAGPLLLGLMLEGWGWRYSFYVWAALTAVTAVASHRYTSRNLQGESKGRNLNIFAGIRGMLTLSFALVVAMSTLIESVFNILVTYVPVYFTVDLGMSYSLTSIITGLGPLTGLAGSFLGGFSGDRYGKYRVGLAVIAVTGLLIFVFPGLNALWTVVAVYGLSRLFQSAYMPLLNGMLAANCPAENMSLGFSFNFVMVSLFTAVTTTLAGWLIESQGTGVIFPMSLVLLAPTCLIVALLWRRAAG